MMKKYFSSGFFLNFKRKLPAFQCAQPELLGMCEQKLRAICKKKSSNLQGSDGHLSSDNEMYMTFSQKQHNLSYFCGSMYMTFGQKQLNFKIGIVKIGKEFPYIQKVEKLVRKSPINFQNRNCQNFKKRGCPPKRPSHFRKVCPSPNPGISATILHGTPTFILSVYALTSNKSMCSISDF